MDTCADHAASTEHFRRSQALDTVRQGVTCRRSCAGFAGHPVEPTGSAAFVDMSG